MLARHATDHPTDSNNLCEALLTILLNPGHPLDQRDPRVLEHPLGRLDPGNLEHQESLLGLPDLLSLDSLEDLEGLADLYKQKPKTYCVTCGAAAAFISILHCENVY